MQMYVSIVHTVVLGQYIIGRMLRGLLNTYLESDCVAMAMETSKFTGMDLILEIIVFSCKH